MNESFSRRNSSFKNEIEDFLSSGGKITVLPAEEIGAHQLTAKYSTNTEQILEQDSFDYNAYWDGDYTDLYEYS